MIDLYIIIYNTLHSAVFRYLIVNIIVDFLKRHDSNKSWYFVRNDPEIDLQSQGFLKLQVFDDFRLRSRIRHWSFLHPLP